MAPDSKWLNRLRREFYRVLGSAFAFLPGANLGFYAGLLGFWRCGGGDLVVLPAHAIFEKYGAFSEVKCL